MTKHSIRFDIQAQGYTNQDQQILKSKLANSLCSGLSQQTNAGWQQEPTFASFLHLQLLHPAITSNSNSSCSQTRGHCWHKAKRKQSPFSQYRVCSSICQSPHRKWAGNISRAENTSTLYLLPTFPAGTFTHTQSWKERGRFKGH